MAATQPGTSSTWYPTGIYLKTKRRSHPPQTRTEHSPPVSSHCRSPAVTGAAPCSPPPAALSFPPMPLPGGSPPSASAEATRSSTPRSPPSSTTAGAPTALSVEFTCKKQQRNSAGVTLSANTHAHRYFVANRRSPDDSGCLIDVHTGTRLISPNCGTSAITRIHPLPPLQYDTSAKPPRNGSTKGKPVESNKSPMPILM